jgi:hypothetical protein
MTGPRLRQAVIASVDLDAVVEWLHAQLGLGEPFADPAVEVFGLRNAVFALGDTFLEVVSPITEGTSAGRLLARRGEACGYLVMFQVPSVAAARARAAENGVREVFAVDLEDMVEAHLHPSDMHGAIVSVSQPDPESAWRWGGPDWEQRSAALSVAGVTVSIRDAVGVAQRWETVLGGFGGARFVSDGGERGVTEIALDGGDPDRPELRAGAVTFTFNGA